MKELTKFYNSSVWIGICLVACIFYSKNLSLEEFETLNDLIAPALAFFFGIQFVSGLIRAVAKTKETKVE